MNGVRRPGQGNGWPVKGQGRRTSQTTAARSIPIPRAVPRRRVIPHHPETPVDYALIGGLLLAAAGLALFGVAFAIRPRGRGRHR